MIHFEVSQSLLLWGDNRQVTFEIPCGMFYSSLRHFVVIEALYLFMHVNWIFSVHVEKTEVVKSNRASLKCSRFQNYSFQANVPHGRLADLIMRWPFCNYQIFRVLALARQLNFGRWYVEIPNKSSLKIQVNFSYRNLSF